MMPSLLEARNILVRTTNWVGDAVMSLPALREVRLAFPQARITLLAKPWVSGVFRAEALADRVLPYPLPGAGWRGTATALRRERFDLALLFQNAFEAALVVRWAGIPMRAGYARDGRSWLLTHAIAVPDRGETPGHECYYYLELLRRLGIIARLPRVDHILLADPPSASAARTLLAEKAGSEFARGRVVGISAGAAFGTAKRWLPERYAAVGQRLAAQGARIVLFGAAAERALSERIAREIGPAAVNLAGLTSLEEFPALVAGCDLFLTNDSGTMHLAAAAGARVLAIFGPTDDIGTRPLGPGARIIKNPVECSPCKLRECPIDHRCMTGLSVEQVHEAAQALLGDDSVSLPVRNGS